MRLRDTFLTLLVVLAVALIAGQIEPLQNPESVFNQQLNRLLPWTIGLTVLGFALFMGLVIYFSLRAGGAFEEERSFREVKQAGRSGAWRYDPAWQRFFALAAGGLLLVCGMFSLFIVIGPPFVKLLMVGALLYAVARTAWGFWAE